MFFDIRKSVSVLQVYTIAEHHVTIFFFDLDKYLVLKCHRILRRWCHLYELLKRYRLRRICIIACRNFLHGLLRLRIICYGIASLILRLSPLFISIEVIRLLFLIGGTASLFISLFFLVNHELLYSFQQAILVSSHNYFISWIVSIQ
jgi:hypothetical protein